MSTRLSGSTGTGSNPTNRPELPAYFPVEPGKTGKIRNFLTGTAHKIPG